VLGNPEPEGTAGDVDARRDEMTRREAVDLYHARCAAIARQLAELRRLRDLIARRWGRPPAWPRW
jgi:hypothetical protein